MAGRKLCQALTFINKDESLVYQTWFSTFSEHAAKTLLFVVQFEVEWESLKWTWFSSCMSCVGPCVNLTSFNNLKLESSKTDDSCDDALSLSPSLCVLIGVCVLCVFSLVEAAAAAAGFRTNKSKVVHGGNFLRVYSNLSKNKLLNSAL